MTKHNEGEGNKTAARRYNRAATKHARSGKSEEAAKAAAKALDSAEGASLRDAERKGKNAAKGDEDPKIARPKPTTFPKPQDPRN